MAIIYKAYQQVLSKQQGQTLSAWREQLDNLKQAYDKMHAFLLSRGLSRQSCSAIILEIEKYRISRCFAHGSCLSPTHNLIQHLSHLDHYHEFDWQAFATVAKKNALKNKRFIKRHLYKLADMEYESLGLRLSLFDRDNYIKDFKEIHRKFHRRILSDHRCEVAIFKLKGKNRERYYQLRDQSLDLAKRYKKLFADLHEAYKTMNAKSKAQYYAFKNRALHQQVLIALEVLRLQKQLERKDIHSGICPSIDELETHLYFYRDYNQVCNLLNNAVIYLQTTCLTEDAQEFTKKGLRFSNSQRHLLTHLIKLAAERESRDLLGYVSRRYTDFRIAEMEKVVTETTDTYIEHAAKKILIAPVASFTSGAADSLRVYRNVRGIMSQFGPAGLPLVWLMALSMGAIKAIQVRGQTENILVRVIRLFELDKGPGYVRPRNAIQHALAASFTLFTSAMFSYLGYLSISSLLVSLTTYAAPLTIGLLAIPTLFLSVTYILQASDLLHRFKVARDLAMQRTQDLHGLHRLLGIYKSFMSLRYNAFWEGFLKSITLAGTLVGAIVSIFLFYPTLVMPLIIAKICATISVSVVTLVLLPNLIDYAGYIGRWLDQHDLRFFEILGLGVDTFAKFALPILTYQACAATILFSLPTFVTVALSLTAAIAVSLCIPKLINLQDRLITHRYGVDINMRMLGRCADLFALKAKAVCTKEPKATDKRHYVNQHLALRARLGLTSQGEKRLQAFANNQQATASLFFRPPPQKFTPDVIRRFSNLSLIAV